MENADGSVDKGYINSRINAIPVSVKCSECGQKITFNQFPLVNFDDNPQYYGMVKGLDVFTVKCPKCGSRAVASYDSLYVSSQYKFFIYLLTDRSNTQKFYNQITYFVQTTLNRKERYDMQKYNTRLVYTVNDLVQKFSIFQLGLDDRAIEITKYGLFDKGVVDRSQHDVILFDGIRDTNLVFYAFNSKDSMQHRLIAVDFQFYNNVIQKIRAIRPKKGETFPNIDSDWVRQRLMRNVQKQCSSGTQEQEHE